MLDKKYRFMNRRGSSIAFFILLLGAFALIFQGVYVQIAFKGGVSQNLVEYHHLDEEVMFNQKFVIVALDSMVHEAFVSSDKNDFENSFRKNMKEIAEIRREELGTNLFLKLANNEYSINNLEGKNYIEINGLFVKTVVEKNEVKWNFNVRKVIE